MINVEVVCTIVPDQWAIRPHNNSDETLMVGFELNLVGIGLETRV